MSALGDFLAARFERGGFSTEDALAVFLPLLQQVVETHDAGLVAPLEGVADLQVDGERIWFHDADRRLMRREAAALRALQPAAPRGVQVVAEVRHDMDLTSGSDEHADLSIATDVTAATLLRPVYLPGYRAYEHLLGHHDPLTDTFVLGLILASLCLGADLGQEEPLRAFVRQRGNLFAIQPDLHPVLAKVITQMTALSPAARPQDLPALLRALADYREQDFDIDFDLQRERGFGEKDLQTRHQIVLARLQQRLFEISRRNRLLHYRETQQTVNLTHASVPLTFDPKNLRAEQILTWGGRFEAAVLDRKKISLNRYLNFEEALYLPSLLDKIRAEARKDAAEFGFNNLRLVICFLRWTNLKEGRERYDSPLLLLPVELTRKKGVRDAHQLAPLSTEAEVNPVLRFYLRELYDLRLPETLDLAEGDVRDLHRTLAEQIGKSESAVHLELVETPRITLIHRRARQRLDQFEKRSRLARRGARTYPKLDYSYSRSDFRPLGLQLFRQKVQPARTRLESILDPRMLPGGHRVAPADPPPVREVEQTFYNLEQGSENPYQWELDLCSVTLGNFKYRKMSLVRDYEALLDGLPANRAFDAVFSLTPPPTGALPLCDLPLEERYPVVACDPTQSRAIAFARGGDSYIIQGPPGTGKSQTITNLIADYVARGKRVLFVCEKRAAIDVVYHRLQQQGLGPVCSLVHDAQADKKHVIADLRQTYEVFTGAEAGAPEEPAEETAEQTAEAPASEQAEAPARASAEDLPAQPPGDVDPDRAAVLAGLQRELEPLFDGHEAMTAPHEELGVPLREALARAVELGAHRVELPPAEREQLPPYQEWVKHRDALARLFRALRDAQPSGIFSEHPLRLLRADLADADRAGALVARHLDAAARELDRLLDIVAATAAPAECSEDLAALRRCAAFAASIEGLARSGRLAALDPGSAPASELRRHLQAWRAAHQGHADAEARAAGWEEPLPREEVATALGQAQALEGSLLSFLKPAWWRMRRVLRRRFDFDRGAVRPTWSQALTALQGVYESADALGRAADELRAEYGFDGPVQEFVDRIERLARGDLPAAEQLLRDYFVGTSWTAGAENVLAWAAAVPALQRLDAELDAVLRGASDLTPDGLRAELRGVLDHLDALPVFVHCLEELRRLPQGLARVIRERPWSPEQLESALVEATLVHAVRGDRRVHRYDGRVRDRAAERLERGFDAWLSTNAAVVLDRIRRAFLEEHRLIPLAAAQMSAAEKERRKVFNKGLRELQHEFKKTMRYKSIRDLSADESGVVLRLLKPVWLMSPLSVSDTLRMEPDAFDVVIFDEASQITLEEAIPAIFRAEQIIVVGDEMQLPPTNFFSTKRTPNSDEEEAGVAVEEADAIDYDLAGNSFLSHATRNLRSCMLGWHYRSRSESLISFSNATFYGGELLTVPEERFAARPRPAIVVADPEEGARRVDDVLERPLGFHLMEGAVYEARRNRLEAEYIAELVRGLLQRETGLSIGIVAFSQAQQGEVEDALERLGRDDPVFRDRLEAEYEREEDGQFLGLLVKNLENIQGDERDVVIMSVCYGPDARGRVRMNFGPINVSGGEKRLNVAFSRAKRHMVLVSSMLSAAVTNDYNVGAHCLKSYLRYAELSSAGDAEGAGRVLQQMRSGPGEERRKAQPVHPVAARLAAALRERGFRCEVSVGQSSFRCSLAVCGAGEERFRLGVLVDDDAYYRQTDPLDRDMMKPRLLRAFGWQVTHVLSKDWHADPDAELARILGLLGQQDLA